MGEGRGGTTELVFTSGILIHLSILRENSMIVTSCGCTHKLSHKSISLITMINKAGRYMWLVSVCPIGRVGLGWVGRSQQASEMYDETRNASPQFISIIYTSK